MKPKTLNQIFTTDLNVLDYHWKLKLILLIIITIKSGKIFVVLFLA